MARAAGQQTSAQQRGSGEQGRASEPRYLTVGRVVGAHGLDGELRIQVLTDDPHRFGRVEQLFLGREGAEPVPWAVRSYRLHRSQVLLLLDGCEDRTAAESLFGMLVQVPVDEAVELEEGEYFEHQILGLEAWTRAGEQLGVVGEIIYTGANDVYVIRSTDAVSKEILVPAIAGVVLEIDLEAGRLVVELPDGLV